MQPDEEIVEGELLPDVIDAAPPATLFRTSDPDLALARMSQVARTLVKVVDDRKLYANINGKRHLLVGAWTTLGGMLGVFPVIAWTRPNETGDGYVARAEARTRDGALVGAAEAECSRAETRWKNRDPYTLRSMASTRAVSRALRGALEEIVVLAGYDPTAAEEMPGDEPSTPSKSAASSRATLLQRQKIASLFQQLKRAAPVVDWASECRTIAGRGDEMSEPGAETLIKQMRAWLFELDGDDAKETET